MTDIKWHFRRKDPGEAIKHGVDTFAFQMSIDTLVRETIQNANDQRLGSKVEVEFVLEELVGPRADRLLAMLGWENGLKDHLSAIAKGNSHLKPRAERAIKSASARKIRTLTIRDFGARGLEGEEDGESGNFAMLCRHVLVTDGEKKQLKGGAFGIGKSVLWAFSDASTVLFSSLPRESRKGKPDFDGEPRFFGRAYLVSHNYGRGNDWHNGDGHFGEIAVERNIEWAKSLRTNDAKEIVAGTTLERDWIKTGTSILIPFLDNPMEETEPSLVEMVDQIQKATQFWFWPSIDSGILEVRVGIRGEKNENLGKVELPKWANFEKRAMSDESKPGTKIEIEGATSQAKIELDIPERIADPQLVKQVGETSLYLTRLTEDEVGEVPASILNSVALIRGAQMVVEYHKSSIPTLLPPFLGVMKAGDFHGRKDSDKAAEYFLRDSEPPAHDRWEKQAEKIKLNYKRGGQKAIEDFLIAIGTKAKLALGTNAVSSGRVPVKLAEMLRGGKGGKTKTRTERFQLVKKELDRDATGSVSAQFSIQRNIGTGPWFTNIALVLLDEQGTQREIPHLSISKEELEGLGVEIIETIEKSDGSIRGYELLVPSDLNEISGELAGQASGALVGLRSLADLRVRYGNRNGVSK